MGASRVLVKAIAAEALAPSALPALKPNQPNQRRAGSEQHEGDVVRQERLASVVAARSQDPGGDQRGGAGVDVHHRAAGEVERAERPEPAAAPDPVADRGIDDRVQTDGEGDECPEAHALDHGAGDQRHGDDREGPLIGEEEEVGNRPLGFDTDAGEQREVEAAEDARAGVESERVAGERPREPRPGERGEAHHHGVERVLGTHQPAVEEGEPGGHEQHQSGRHEHPGDIGGGEGDRHNVGSHRGAPMGAINYPCININVNRIILNYS